MRRWAREKEEGKEPIQTKRIYERLAVCLISLHPCDNF